MINHGQGVDFARKTRVVEKILPAGQRLLQSGLWCTNALARYGLCLFPMNSFTVDTPFAYGANPAGIWCENDVVLPSMRRDYLASTLIRRHFGTKCPLGNIYLL